MPCKGELLYCWVSNGLNVLVPKQRGSGFLKVPYGHHIIAELSEVEAAANCDLFGLDGALAFECGGAVYHGGDAKRQAFVARVMPMLEKHYGISSRQIDDVEFWNSHPTKTLATP